MNQQNQFNQSTTPQQPQSSLQSEAPQKPRLPSWATVLIIILALFIVGLVIYGAYRYFVLQPEPFEEPPVGKELAEEPSDITVDWGYFENKSLGISFRYPTNWGEIEEKENISINYLFPTYLPDKLKGAFLEKELGENFITEFQQWGRKKQAEFLKKDIEYNDFLSRDFVISFSKNNNLTLHAFNRGYVNMSGYEAVVPIYPSYQGDLSLGQNACSQELKSIISQVNIDNFYKDDCSLLENGLVILKGSVNDILPSGEEALIVAVANLKRPKEYNGLLVSYHYKNFKNPSSQLLTYFGHSGGLVEEDSSVNIKACNSFGGGSTPSAVTFQNFHNRKIDDNFINEFKEKITSDISKMNIDKEISEMVVSKAQEELENNKGKTLIYYRSSDKEKYYCLWCSGYNEQMDSKINSFPDIKKYLPEMTHNDLLCGLYKIDKKANLDTFKEEAESDVRITELNNFLSTVSITN